MAIWTIVPVKPLRRGKSRLSSVLDDESREALNHCLLENTLETLKSIPMIEEVLVISRDPHALALARSLQAKTIQESGAPELNQALERATLFAKRFAVHAILIIPADLPLINTLDIEAMLAVANNPPVVAIAPDRHRRGTNAMLVSPPGMFRYRYGENSFQEHVALALKSGAHLEIFERPGLALDLDLPEDLDLLSTQVKLLDDSLLNQLLNSAAVANGGKNNQPKPSISSCLEAIGSLETGGHNETNE